LPTPAGPLSRLLDLKDKYDGVLSDIWGVLHNGVTPHEGAVAALSAYRAAGGRVVLITNAARPDFAIRAMLDEIGVPREAYDAIISSGDVTRHLMAAYAGRTVHHVGPDSELSLFEGLDVTLGDVNDAAAVVVTKLYDPRHTPDDYMQAMTEWRARNLPFICANPDKVVESGDRIVYCPGALADIYEEMGGTVLVAGKPHAPIYEGGLTLLETAAGRPIPRNRVLAIGDSVRTDATGAAAMGLDLLFITGSIHAEELNAHGDADPKAVIDLVAPSGANLVGYQTYLK